MKSTVPIRVLIADDSAVARLFLTHLIEADPRLRVAGTVADGQSACDFVARIRPDVVLMDIHMPRLDGLEATRRIMRTNPLPIVVCSATPSARDTVTIFESLEAGALACIEKPVGVHHPRHAEIAAQLLRTIRLMAEVNVVRRHARAGNGLANAEAPALAASAAVNGRRAPAGGPLCAIGIGASTGGPPVLHAILAALPKDFPAPLLVVQHISPGFVGGMAEWLNQTGALPVHIASDGMPTRRGHVYLAPDEAHLGIAPDGAIVLSRHEPENHVRPAVSFLFRSLARHCGSRALGVLLTGMGSDGAQELKTMKDAGATTIAQDRESSIVHGMPGAAIALGAATHVLPASRIAGVLADVALRRRGGPGCA